MIHRSRDNAATKGWFTGPWDSPLPVPVGYARAGVNEPHVHQRMYEVYLVATGHGTAVVDGKHVDLKPGDMLTIEPGEVHAFIANSDDYSHFVIQTPYVAGDKVFVQQRS